MTKICVDRNWINVYLSFEGYIWRIYLNFEHMYYYLCWPQNNYFMFVRNNWKGQIYGSNTILHYYMYFFHKKEKYSFLTNREWIHLLVWDLLLCLYENTHKPLLPSLSAEDPLKHCFVCNSTKVFPSPLLSSGGLITWSTCKPCFTTCDDALYFPL